LQPWAAHTFEPEVGNIGPKTYEKIFQLLLRLKANTIWPAMHDCTRAFFTIPGNREMAKKYHIVVGTSHAEPMLRNNVDEWKTSERGAFNYFSNSNEVNKYWEERITQVSDSTNQVMVTVGMRGIHDSKMEGEATAAEQVEMLKTIITNQRNLLAPNRRVEHTHSRRVAGQALSAVQYPVDTTRRPPPRHRRHKAQPFSSHTLDRREARCPYKPAGKRREARRQGAE